MTISIELARGVHGRVASISHETIYQAVYDPQHRGLPLECHRGLHLKRRRRKHRNAAPPSNMHSLGEFNLISTRPQIAAERVEVGHLEGDLIVGAYNRSAIITVFDRTSRYVWLGRLPAGKNANGVHDAAVTLLRRIPAALRATLTWDQGSEMARHHELAAAVGIDMYFAEPKSPWQRPTNENGNALVRRWMPRGTDLNHISDHDCQLVEYRINTIPRRSLNWDTALNVYHHLSASTP